MYKLGLDIGSTTIKVVLLDDSNEIIMHEYYRHFSEIEKHVKRALKLIYQKMGNIDVKVQVSGSSGLGISTWLNINFIQEVIACSKAVQKFIPETDVVIELGGEDAKLTFFDEVVDQRMNGSCAGGTGAFIDQMSKLLNTDATGLNELAKSFESIYPIAARCGVFAKTDIQPLINEGVKKEDIAASIYQAVVNQTISGLSAGKTISGNIAFLGGPLTFSSELRARFVDTLDLKEEQIIFPENSLLYVALGSAIATENIECLKLETLLERSKSAATQNKADRRLEPLFDNEQELKTFKERHAKNSIQEVSDYQGKVFVGIDAGSTTSKLVVISKDGELVYNDYQNNRGNPLETVLEMLKKMYKEIGENVEIIGSASTGYGELLVKNAFHLDLGEIETICHYKAASYFNPQVDFILDIGGQDMKCMRVDDGLIYDIMLNEACSSGCGSFIESFAKALDVEIEDFAEQSLLAKEPADLGSRCTVFMNSKVKQVQKEGASIGDISAGLAYSVIKNVLVKVIKVNDFSTLGDNLVVSGGTFYNNGVLRAFEKIIGKNVIKPNISGLLGAFGAALKAKEAALEVSTILTYEELNNFTYTTTPARCKLCENNCPITINKFNNREKFISGNKCERGAGSRVVSNLPNMYEYKYKRLFSYESKQNAKNGKVGLVRALNTYEHYPFWHTFFTALDFEVVISERSSKKLYEKGMSSITSDTICYPAKLVHGHVKSLIEKNVDMIFYPCVPFESKERKTAAKNYNCPIVISYPEVVANNMDLEQIVFKNPFIDMANIDNMLKVLKENLQEFSFTTAEIKNAVELAKAELFNYRRDIALKGEEILDYALKNNLEAIVLAGRPYHIDPEINHGLEKIINELGMVTLSEDSIAHLSENKPLWVLDQWVYHSRVYSAAEVVTQYPNLQLVQLNSFGCGIDAIVGEQVKTILENGNKHFTIVKIDEGNNLGAVKIRLRSLQAVSNSKRIREKDNFTNYKTPEFTKNMKNHTILMPQMSPIHFNYIEAGLKGSGYNVEVLKEVSKEDIHIGEEYVNNDSCFPAIIVIGQLINALKSGKYDLENTSLLISQTGGGCRASNYIGQLRKALHEANLGHISVISFNLAGTEKSSGFKVSLAMINRALMALSYGDLMMQLTYRLRPYEVVKGTVDKLQAKWDEKIKNNIINGNLLVYRKIINDMIDEFNNVEVEMKEIPRVTVVGEILIKYHPVGNNDLFTFLESEGCEVIVPGLTEFVLYSAYNNIFNYENYKVNKHLYVGSKAAIKLINTYRSTIIKKLRNSPLFSIPTTIHEKVENINGLISAGNQTGEGWLLSAEIVESVKEGINNVIAVQPFACLPNHMFAKSMIKPIKKRYPQANIVAIDYDPGMSSVNQINRIKLMIEVAKEKIKK